jgi:hypothetical protein
MNQAKSNASVGDTVKVQLGRNTRWIEIEEFSQKDDKPTIIGPVLRSTEPDEYTPDTGWAYLRQVREIIE